ncbi:MAG: glutamate racemase [Deltaproteobacteria bacterium]|nr:glutamate racemase [Deltaproteobacteria bacterium]
MPTTGPIGIFDSGIGGLTVSHEIARLLPSEDLLYLGDTARVPYGSKSPETVIHYSVDNVQFLTERKAKMIVIACNTASAFALPILREKFSVPMIGVIEPGVRGALSRTRNQKIGVIGTEGTIRSQAYATLLKKFNPKAEVYSIACPLFVPLVEEGWLSGEESRAVVARYLSPLKSTGIDTLILGCTHYPLLKPLLREVMGESVALIDSAEETAKELVRLLKTKNLLKGDTGAKKGRHSYCVTDSPERFARVGSLFLGENLDGVERVSVPAAL